MFYNCTTHHVAQLQVEPGLDVGAPEEVDVPGLLLPGVQDEGPTLGPAQEVRPQSAVSQNLLGEAQHRRQTLWDIIRMYIA